MVDGLKYRAALGLWHSGIHSLAYRLQMLNVGMGLGP